MKRKLTSFLSVLALISGVFLLTSQTGCSDGQQISRSGARIISGENITKVPRNSKGLTTEQQNIDEKVRVTTDPTKIMWIHLIALDGKIVKRMPVRNKVTSSGKRLEPKSAADGNGAYPDSPFQYSNSSDYIETDELIQPDGTFGDSDPYIYWFDPMGRYHQWGTAGGLGYLLTDYPIDLQNPQDEISGLYNIEQKAREWQEQQEEMLRKKEGR